MFPKHFLFTTPTTLCKYFVVNMNSRLDWLLINCLPYLLPGYYVYMRERRDQLRSMYPEMPFYEIIRQLAQEWNNMDREVKQVLRQTPPCLLHPLLNPEFISIFPEIPGFSRSRQTKLWARNERIQEDWTVQKYEQKEEEESGRGPTKFHPGHEYDRSQCNDHCQQFVQFSNDEF